MRSASARTSGSSTGASSWIGRAASGPAAMVTAAKAAASSVAGGDLLPPTLHALQIQEVVDQRGEAAALFQDDGEILLTLGVGQLASAQQLGKAHHRCEWRSQLVADDRTSSSFVRTRSRSAVTSRSTTPTPRCVPNASVTPNTSAWTVRGGVLNSSSRVARWSGLRNAFRHFSTIRRSSRITLRVRANSVFAGVSAGPPAPYRITHPRGCCSIGSPSGRP